MENYCCKTQTLFDIDTLLFKWMKLSKNLSSIDYISSIGLLCEDLQLVRPSKLIMDFTNFDFEINSELMLWTIETLLKRMQVLEIYSLAVVIPANIPNANQIQMIFTGDYISKINFSLFTNCIEGQLWLSRKQENPFMY